MPLVSTMILSMLGHPKHYANVLIDLPVFTLCCVISIDAAHPSCFGHFYTLLLH
jgi:hypothetical protein